MSFEIKLQEAEIKALKWLIHSYEVGENTGFSHSRRNYLPSLIAWRKAYPETSGYMIENFLKFNDSNELKTIPIGLQVSDWLVNIQNVNGSYNSGISSQKESFFNTSQILFGLKDAFDYTQNMVYKNAYIKSLEWLESCIDSNGKCIKGLYVDQYFASYYSRSFWPIFKILNADAPKLFYKSLELLWGSKNESNSFKNMSFHPHTPALTHTIAYTWEGFFESAIILDRPDILEHCIRLADQVSAIVMKDKFLHAEYSENWIPSKNYKCLTGQAQFTSMLCKSFLHSKKDIYLEAAMKLINEMLYLQVSSKNIDHDGAFPASIPQYGGYFPYQYVNWTNKFFLDSCYYMKKCLQV